MSQDTIPRVSPPPAVRVPTLEPSTPSFTGTSMLRSHIHEKHTHASTLSDHYKPLQVNSARRSTLYRDPLAKTVAPIDSPHSAHVMHDIRETNTIPGTTKTVQFGITPTASAAATVTMEDFTHSSPLYQPMGTFSHAKPSDSHTQWSASAAPVTHVLRPSLLSTGKPRREVTPTRPAWNQNCPTPRAKPTVSTPQTEPRRLTRETSADARSRPWRESMTRTDSTRGKLNTEIGSKINTSTSMSTPQHSRVAPTSARKTSSMGVEAPTRNISRTTRDSATRNEKITLQARLDFLEKSLQDAHERATRAEARCDELDISLQTLAQQHRDSTLRLEERNVQLHAQVQCMMQWMQGLNATRVGQGNVFKDPMEEQEEEYEEEEQERDRSLNSPEVLCGHFTGDDILHSSYTSVRPSSEGVEGREITARSTAVRVPPSPPMTLRLQRQ